MRTLSFVLAMLIVCGGFIALIPMHDMTVEAADIPATIDGDWTVTGTESYDGGNCVMTGNLIIESGGDLTLDNVTLALNNGGDGEFYIQVLEGGSLTLKNTTIKSNTQFQSSVLMSLGTIYVEDCILRDFGPDWWGQGVNVDGGVGSFYRTDFINNDVGLYVRPSTTTVVDCNITTTYESGMFIEMTSAAINGIKITDAGQGVVAGDWAAALFVLMGPTSMDIYDAEITDNHLEGLWTEDTTINIYNSTIEDNQRNDIVLSPWMQCDINAYNVTHGTASIDPWGMGGSGSLNVHWWANVSATWESDGSPAEDADLEIKDKNGLSVLSEQLDENGEIWYIPIKEYEHKMAGKTFFTPHTFNVTGERDGKTRWGEREEEIEESTTLEFILDDMPPGLTITSPAEGFATNASSVMVEGATDVGSNVWVGGALAAVGMDGTFSLEHGLVTEGINNIIVTAKDIVGNEMSAEVNITRDTTPPTVTIDTPEEGSLFNYSAILVSGTAEVGANLTVNEEEVEISADGKYTTTLELLEGEHTITAHCVDPVGNQQWATVKLTIDRTAPVLSIVSPSDGHSTNEPSVQVIGATELMASVTVNGKPVTLAGSRFQTNIILQEGVNTVTAQSCDKALNCAQVTINITMDSTPPDLTVIYPPTTDEVLTNQDEVTITGMTEPGAKVTVGGKGAEVLANGSFSKTVKLTEGPNSFIIRAEDALGNPTQETRKIKRDSTPPSLEITYPDEGHRTNEVQVRLEGTIETGAELTVNGVKATFTGASFERIVDLENEGENIFTLVATDLAGNTKTAQVTIVLDTVVNLDVTAPLDGDETKEENITVTGTTDPGASVWINDEEVDVDEKGRFEMEVPLEIGENTIKVSVEDDVGNTKDLILTVTRAKRADPNQPGPNIGAGGNLLWLLIALVIIIVAIVLVAAMMKRKKGSPPDEPPQEPVTPPQPPAQQWQQPQPPPQQPYQQPYQDPYNQGYGGGHQNGQSYGHQYPPPPPPPGY